nr:ribonuclease H-like domain-containing protein [Tanacetum cinerariifolium]
ESKKSSHQPKDEDTNQEKLYLLHMDLCGPMRVASINEKRYILVIVDDYSRFTWTLGFSLVTRLQRKRSESKTEGPGLGPGFQSMTHATSIRGLVSKHVSQQPCIPPNRDDWDRFFQPMFDEHFNPPTIVVSPVQEVAAPRAEVLADSHVSISINQDAPSTSIPSSQEQEHSSIISQGDPSRSVSTRKQLKTDAMWCCFDT